MTTATANAPVWQSEGNLLDVDGSKGMSIQQALKKSGLDWTVEKCPIYGPQGQLIQGRYGVQRSTDQEILGVVGKTWTPVQNLDGFQIVADVIEQAGGKDVFIEATGDFDDGRQVWVMVRVGEELQIAGETYASYMLFINGHNGRRSVTCTMMTTRFVCTNMMGWGMDDGRTVRVRHTKTAAARIKTAAHILKMRNVADEQLAKQGEWLVEQTMDDGEFAKFMDDLMPLPDSDDESPAKTMITDRRAKVASLYFGADNLEPIRGTRWGALQAVCEYSDYARSFKTPETQLKSQFAVTAAPIKQSAFDLLYTA